MEVWQDEVHLKKGIEKILTGTFFTKKAPHDITKSDLRSMLRRYSGTQMVSNFRPTAAAALYDVFVDKDSPLEGTTAGTVWDPSMGYGGRLLGAIAAGVNYIMELTHVYLHIMDYQKLNKTLVIVIRTIHYTDKVVRLLYLKRIV